MAQAIEVPLNTFVPIGVLANSRSAFIARSGTRAAPSYLYCTRRYDMNAKVLKGKRRMTSQKDKIEQEMNNEPKPTKDGVKLEAMKQDVFEVQQFFKDMPDISDKADQKEASKAVQRFIKYLSTPNLPDNLMKQIGAIKDDLMKKLGENGAIASPGANPAKAKKEPKKVGSAPMRGIAIEVSPELCKKYRLEASTFVSRKALALAVTSGLDKTEAKPPKYATWAELFSHEGPAVFLHNNAPDAYALCPMPSLPVSSDTTAKTPKAVKVKPETKPVDQAKGASPKDNAGQTPNSEENLVSEQISPIESPVKAEPKKGSKQAQQAKAVKAMAEVKATPKEKLAKAKAAATQEVDIDGKKIKVTPLNSAAAPSQEESPVNAPIEDKKKQVNRKR